MLTRLQFNKGIYKDKYLLFIDQTLLSVVNFGSILLLAKIASIPVFGSFVVTFSYSYFIHVLATLFLSGPILIFLSKKWKEKEGAYLFSTLVLNGIVNSMLSGVLFLFLKQQIPEISFFPFCLLTFSMTFYDILKKFIFSSTSINIKYGLISTIILIVFFFGLLFLFKESLTLNSILNVYWFSFFAANGFILAIVVFKGIINKTTVKLNQDSINFAITITKTHYNYSKWIILGGMGFWAYTQGIYILANFFEVSDLTISRVRTIQNLLGVFNILLITLENHYTPIFASESTKGTIVTITPLIKQFFRENYFKILSLFILAVPIGLVFYNMMYLEKYGNGTFIFLLFLFMQLALVIIKPFSIALKSIEKTSPFFTSHIFAVIGMLVAFAILILFFPTHSLAISITLANLIYVFVIAFYFKKSYRTALT